MGFWLAILCQKPEKPVDKNHFAQFLEILLAMLRNRSLSWLPPPTKKRAQTSPFPRAAKSPTQAPHDFSSPDSASSLLESLIAKAKKAGADAADALLIDSTSLAVGYRLGQLETLERSESGDLGLRVFIGKKQAMVSSTDRRAATLDELVARAVTMAKLAPEDEFCGIADPDVVAKNWPQVRMADKGDASAEHLIALVKEAEDVARSREGRDQFRKRGCRREQGRGLARLKQRFSRRLSAAPVTASACRFWRAREPRWNAIMSMLPAIFRAICRRPQKVGREAGERAVKRLGARKMPTAQVPVIFEPRIAGSLLGRSRGAISGSNVARGTSFLKDKIGDRNFFTGRSRSSTIRSARAVCVRGLSMPKGLLPQKRKMIDHGVLTTWLLDLRSARQLKLQSTGHASRGAGGSPSPSASNLYMEAGSVTPAELMRDIKQGFYVTELMGMGVNRRDWRLQPGGGGILDRERNDGFSG